MVLNNKMVVPIALGLSLVTVTAVVVYFVFKKDEEDAETTKNQIKTGRNHMIEVPVPKALFPALIGRGGSNLKQLEKKSGASFHVKRLPDKDYDVCLIRGRIQSAQLAETLVHEFIRNQPIIEEETIIVPSWACGRIIGVGGTSINEISHQSGARVKVDGSGDSPGRLVSVKGTMQQIIVAKEMIEKCVAQEKCRREIEHSKRTARAAQASASNAETPSDISGDVKNSSRKKHVTSSKSDAGGAAIEVYVSAVSSPGRFWVQFVGPQVAQLDELVEHMTEYYGNKDHRQTYQLTEVSIGQVVAAVFRHDGRWYRARVCDVRANEFDSTQKVADVFYLDYGDSEYVATHELCELRADLLKLRFQAMECFLAGVRPKGPAKETSGGVARWDKWPPEAIERFEELTQVARWKPLISRTCSYKKFVTVDGDKEKEIPGIKLYDVTEGGEIDIGATLISEGWAEETPPPPVTHPPPTPFGDLGNSKVLGMLGDRGERSSSLPKDKPQEHSTVPTKPTSTSLASGLERAETPNPVHLSYPKEAQHKVNGSDDFLHTERENHETASSETLVPSPGPKLDRSELDELKANMNRIDSHHGNLDTLGRHADHNNV